MHAAPPCPPDEYLEAIALARLILPAEIHLQAPPNLSDDFGVLLDAGIDDWGGVSPVTADHVNPERPWPARDRLRAVTEAAGFELAPRLTIYPEFALDPERVARRRPPLRRCSTAPTPRASAATIPARCSPRRSARSATWATAPRSCSSAGARPPWYTGADVEPPVLVPGPIRPPRGAVGRGARRRAARARSPARTRSSRCSRPGAGEVARRRRAGRRAAGATVTATSVTFVQQPQHQLHERLHVQVPVLRVLEGPAVAQPAGHALPAHPRRHRRAGRSRPGTWAPPRCACRAASTRTSTATTTSTSPGP